MSWLTSSAFLLAKRPLSEHKEIWEFFAERYGRLSLVVPLSRRYRCLDYGQLIDLAWRPASALPTVRTLELQQCFGIFSADTGIFILYLNELIRNLLAEQDAQPHLFASYTSALKDLIRSPATSEWVLRRFELLLLDQLGFALPLAYQTLTPMQHYDWRIPEGIVSAQGDLQICGQVLDFLAAWRQTPTPALSLSAVQWQMLKRLLRETLAYYLAGKSLQTRKLWQLLHS